MESIRYQFDLIVNSLDAKHKRYIHSKSLENFIIHLNDFTISEEKELIHKLISEYIEVIVKSEINSVTGIEFYDKYISPLGGKYKVIGFISIVPIRYLFVFSIMVDSLLYLAFFNFPYPSVTILVIVYFLIVQKRYYRRNKVYGIYY
jgi:hypothetical protein